MSQISKAIFGALAVSVACGAVQLAFGHDLPGTGQAASAAPETGINRAAKADRDAVIPASAPMRTLCAEIQRYARYLGAGAHADCQ